MAATVLMDDIDVTTEVEPDRRAMTNSTKSSMASGLRNLP